MNGKHWRRVLLAALPACLPVVAQAQEDRPGVQVAVEVRAVYNDNFFYQEEGDEQAAYGTLLKPSIDIRRGSQRLSWSAGVSGELGVFDQLRDISDYADYALSLGADWTPASRHHLAYAVQFSHDHDAFGTERTEQVGAADVKLDEWRRLRNTLTYRIGMPTDRVNLELQAAHQDKTYTTNEAVTRFLDHEILAGTVTALYNYSPKTSVFASVIARTVDFDETPAGALDRSADEYAYRLGVRWAASAKTTGEVSAGYFQRDPKDALRRDFNSVDWNARVTWAATSTRNFVLSTGRYSQESFIASVAFINNQFYTLDWAEDWTSRFQTNLSVGFLDAEFVGSSRTDEALIAGLTASYQVVRSLRVLGGVRWVDRDASGLVRDYAQTIGHIGFRYSN